MISSRRSFLVGLGAALITAPAIVRASSIMPVKQMIIDPYRDLNVAEMVALLDGRIDDAHDNRRTFQRDDLYTRYDGYEAIEFDATKQSWKSPAEIAEETRIQVRGELFELKLGHHRRSDPDYEIVKTRWTKAYGP